MSIVGHRPLKLAIVGTMFGAYGVAAAARQVEGMEVIAICGKDPEKTAARAKEYNIPRTYTSWRTMLDEMQPDLCAIITPPHASGEICAEALARGIGVMVEKLPAGDRLQTQQLAALAEQKNIANVADYIYPQLHTFRAVQDWLQDGRIGATLSARVDWLFESYDVRKKSDSWKLWPDQGGGLVAFFLSHVLYYCEYLFGHATTVQAHVEDKTGRGGETLAIILLKTTSGIPIHINGCNAMPPGDPEHRITILGERGKIIIQNPGANPMRDFTAECFDGNGNCLAAAAEKDYIPDDKITDSRAWPVARLLQNLHEQACGQPESFYVPHLRDAARVHQLVDAVRSSNQTQEVVHV